MNRILAAIASVLVLGAARPAGVATANFQITVDQTATGWKMQCAKGCAWTDLSFGCGADCRALVDESGITVAITTKVRGEGFAFVIERTSKGWRAKAVNGTTWLNVSWDCHAVVCRAHLDATGVSGL
jgi:hypothetical protein